MDSKRASERVMNCLVEALGVVETMVEELRIKSPTDWRITVLAVARMIQKEGERTECRVEVGG